MPLWIPSLRSLACRRALLCPNSITLLRRGPGCPTGLGLHLQRSYGDIHEKRPDDDVDVASRDGVSSRPDLLHGEELGRVREDLGKRDETCHANGADSHPHIRTVPEVRGPLESSVAKASTASSRRRGPRRYFRRTSRTKSTPKRHIRSNAVLNRRSGRSKASPKPRLRGPVSPRLKRRYEIFKRYVARQSARSAPASGVPTIILLGKFFWRRRLRALVKAQANCRDLRIQDPVYDIVDAKATSWAKYALDRVDGGSQTLPIGEIKAHFQLSMTLRKIWSKIGLYLLAYKPERMFDFLAATHVQPYPATPFFEHALLFLARGYIRQKATSSEKRAKMRRVAEMVCMLNERESEKWASYNSPLIAMLLQYCNPELVIQMYDGIKCAAANTPGHTYLHFASWFAKKDYHERSLDALFAAKGRGLNVNHLAFKQCCSSLLRKTSSQPDGLRLCLHTVNLIVDMGVKLNKPLCDIVILNAAEAGDMKTAYSVYQSLKERGLQPDHFTFSALLKGCRANIDDPIMLNDTIRDAIANMNVRKSELVANQILHCLALHHSRNHPQTALKTLTEAYAQFFDLEPLHRLGLPIPHVVQDRTSPDLAPMPPSRQAMTFVIGATLNDMVNRSLHSRNALPIYARWRKLVGEGDPDLSCLAETEHLANVFLMAFINDSSSLVHAAHTVRDMQGPLPETAIVEQVRPSVQTWSILVNGFARHKKHRLAEQVVSHMRNQGLEPNQVTWNSLAKAYSHSQDSAGTVHTLRRLEKSGGVWDFWTFSALRKLRRHEKVMQKVRAGELQRPLDFSEELKEGLGGRLKTLEALARVTPVLDKEREGRGMERLKQWQAEMDRKDKLLHSGGGAM